MLSQEQLNKIYSHLLWPMFVDYYKFNHEGMSELKQYDFNLFVSGWYPYWVAFAHGAQAYDNYLHIKYTTKVNK